MLDVMSMCQFLLMTSNLLGVVSEAGEGSRFYFSIPKMAEKAVAAARIA
jgi:hypothetical protein